MPLMWQQEHDAATGRVQSRIDRALGEKTLRAINRTSAGIVGGGLVDRRYLGV